MALDLQGKLIQILPVQSGVSKAGKDWSKQEFIIETQEQFPKKVCFTLFGDKTDLLQGISEGEELKVSFNLESREYNERWFHNINAWKIEKITSQSGDVSAPSISNNDLPPMPNEDDGLPF
ncbi:MAG: DUF3127 domain-containing protein [Saprospiraceae bacterium]|nr:DUF3127 domain-containing protein [Saprospiraceae bacterium]